MTDKDVDYVILEKLGYSSTNRCLFPAIKRYPEKFKIVKHLKDPDTYLIKFRPNLGYTGEWKGDKREGNGKYAWENGQYFEGKWKDNLRNGNGVLHLTNGNTMTGAWLNDKLEGDFIITDTNAVVIEKSIYKANIKIGVYDKTE